MGLLFEAILVPAGAEVLTSVKRAPEDPAGHRPTGAPV